MAIIPKTIYSFNIILTKIPAAFLQKYKAVLKIHMETPGTQNTQSNIEKKKIGGLTLPFQSILQSYNN